MDKLGTYIVKLLNENLPVFIPGLGTFKKERVPAAFDENTNTFLAPAQRITLHTEKGSTAPLISAISEHENSSEEESEDQLKKIIHFILLELDEKGKYYIQDLGELIKEGDTITFAEGERKDDIPYYRNIDEIKLIEPSKKEPLVERETKDKEEALEEEILPMQEFEPKGRPINWLWPAVIIIAMITAGALWFLNSEKLKRQELGIQGFEGDKNEAVSDTTLILNSEATEVSEQDTTATLSLENTEHTKEQVQREPERIYEIIIVSFGKLSEAEKYVENMNAKGYNIRILENQSAGNLYKVSYRSFRDEAEAQLELNKVRETIAKEAWIYKTKK